MPRLFLVADTHFDLSCPDHIESSTQIWNERVGADDTVWHLGDVAANLASLDVLAQLNGIKYLIAGNNDTLPAEVYLQYFMDLRGMVVFRDMSFTHVPVDSRCLDRVKLNFHGHLHTDQLINERKPDGRYFCVSQQQHNGPISYDHALALALARGARIKDPTLRPQW